MSTEKFHRIIMAFSFLICVFIYADSYLMPLKNSTEIIQSENYYVQRGRHGSTSRTFELVTNKRKFDVPDEFYQVVNQNDTIVVQSSILTNSVQKAQINKDGYEFTYIIGFIRAMAGFLYLALITLGIIIFFSFYTYLKNLQGRANMTYVLLILSLLLLFFHIGFNIF